MPKRRQRGLTVVSMVFLLVVAAAAAYVALKTVPIFKEYFAIRRDINRIATEGTAQSPADVRKSFDDAAAQDNIRAIKGSDLDVTSRAGRLVIGFAYRAETPLVSNVSLYFDFQGSTGPAEQN